MPESASDRMTSRERVIAMHILGYTHMLQYTMPAENVSAILRTVREIQQGVHDAG